jgi:HD-GYP domain-containing protein (c-di-GMP phosphodiesterase class II)
MDDKEYDMEKTRLSLKEIMKKDMEDELLHGVKVCNLAFHFGKRLGLSYDRAIELATAGLLHDMGKLQMSRRLYGRDEESLEVEEIVRTRSHSRITYDILMRYDYSDFILETILYHHENYDGTGYPRNLVATDIPEGARMLRVVDAFITLTSDKAYRKAALKEIRNQARTDKTANGFGEKVWLKEWYKSHPKDRWI